MSTTTYEAPLLYSDNPYRYPHTVEVVFREGYTQEMHIA